MGPFAFPAPNAGQLNRLTAEQRAEAIAQSYKIGKRVKGFTITAGTGNSSNNLQLSGQGQWLLGIAIIGATSGCTGQLVINNDVMIESTVLDALAINPAAQGRDYYEFSRGLNGNDQIKLDVVNASGQSRTFNVLLYYI